ncbi:MAG: 3-phosphoserine/phosphohydroxythreonine transaminase [Christensenellales bacterium]
MEMRVYNFAPGPACLPVEVLMKIREHLPEYMDKGMSVMEMSHRSKMFEEILTGAQDSLRRLMNIPENYHILFLQGGASLQFDMVPMNLMTIHKKADFVNTGMWTKRAIAEAKLFGAVHVVASSEDKVFNYIPVLNPADFDPDADYFHIATNNTIYGTRYVDLPQTGNVPLVGDMSSNILSQEYDVSKFGLIFAGAQKNIGPSGLTVVIIRDDLVARAPANTPAMLKYAIHVKENSLYNTPPTFGIYVAGLMFAWTESFGGVKEMQKQNEYKASLLYGCLDNSGMFSPTVQGACRSLMNIPFVSGNEELDEKFVKEAAKSGLVNLKGHRSVGGMRASLYNAMPVEGVKALVAFIQKFELENK